MSPHRTQIRDLHEPVEEKVVTWVLEKERKMANFVSANGLRVDEVDLMD